MEVLILRKNTILKKEYDRQYYQKNRERILQCQKEYQKKHWKEIKLKQKKNRMKNPEHIQEIERKSYQKHIKSKKEYSKQYNQKLKLEVLTHYGGDPPKCICCEELEIKFLTIDHINGRGCRHRSEIKRFGYNFYVWLRKNNYPEGYQVLCYNCNCGKKGNNGVCPHEQ